MPYTVKDTGKPGPHRYEIIKRDTGRVVAHAASRVKATAYTRLAHKRGEGKALGAKDMGGVMPAMSVVDSSAGGSFVGPASFGQPTSLARNRAALLSGRRKKLRFKKKVATEPQRGVAGKDFNPSDHPRGQPDNAGQFGPGGGGEKPQGQNQSPHKENKPQSENAKPKRYSNGQVKKYIDSEKIKNGVELDIGIAEDGAKIYRWSSEKADSVGEWTDSRELAEKEGREAADKLKKPAKGFGQKWFDGLSHGEVEAFKDYSLNAEAFNTQLRSGTGGVSAEMDGAIARSMLPKDTILYRGLTSDLHFEVGDEFEDLAYVSTSKSREVAERFMDRDGQNKSKGVLIQINAKKGSRVADMAGLSPSYGSEQEMLFPRKSTFRFTGIRHEGDTKIYEVQLVKK